MSSHFSLGRNVSRLVGATRHVTCSSCKPAKVVLVCLKVLRISYLFLKIKVLLFFYYFFFFFFFFFSWVCFKSLYPAHLKIDTPFCNDRVEPWCKNKWFTANSTICAVITAVWMWPYKAQFHQGLLYTPGLGSIHRGKLRQTWHRSMLLSASPLSRLVWQGIWYHQRV